MKQLDRSLAKFFVLAQSKDAFKRNGAILSTDLDWKKTPNDKLERLLTEWSECVYGPKKEKSHRHITSSTTCAEDMRDKNSLIRRSGVKSNSSPW